MNNKGDNESGGNRKESSVKEVVVAYGLVMRKYEHYIGRGKGAMEMKVGLQGRRKRGRPKRRWTKRRMVGAYPIGG